MLKILPVFLVIAMFIACSLLANVQLFSPRDDFSQSYFVPRFMLAAAGNLLIAVLGLATAYTLRHPRVHSVWGAAVCLLLGGVILGSPFAIYMRMLPPGNPYVPMLYFAGGFDPRSPLALSAAWTLITGLWALVRPPLPRPA